MKKKDYFAHEKAIVDSDKIGSGTRIWAFSHILEGAVIGSDCNIGEGCFIENNVLIGNCVTIKNGVSVWDMVTLEDGVFVGPNAVFTNDMNPRARFKKKQDQFLPIKVCEGATIGANATIVCGVTVGRNAFIGAGCVVVEDVPDHAIVVGNPGRKIGYMCSCGEKIDFDSSCSCGKKYVLENGSCLEG